MRNKDIIKQYVNTGNAIPEYQLNKLNKSLLNSYFRKRFIEVSNRGCFQSYEWNKLNANQQEELIDILGLYMLFKTIPVEKSIEYINNKRIKINTLVNIEGVFRFFVNHDKEINKDVFRYYFNEILNLLNNAFNHNAISRIVYHINEILQVYLIKRKEIDPILIDDMRKKFGHYNYVNNAIDRKLEWLDKIIKNDAQPRYN